MMKKTTTRKKTSGRKPKPEKRARATVRRKTTKAPVEPPAPVAVKVTKKNVVLTLLQREKGATLAELMSATGWQAHSVRGFISGTVRKQLGLRMRCVKQEDGASAYRLAHEPC